MTRNLTAMGALVFAMASGQAGAQTLEVQVPQDVERLAPSSRVPRFSQICTCTGWRACTNSRAG
jgi:hypothetical protein